MNLLAMFRRRDPAAIASDEVWPIMPEGTLAPIARAAAPADDERDANGRFVSEHRRKVHEKCREQCAKLGIDVPEALR